MRFSIVTPSFRSSRWLRLCVPSVADQGVDLEHIVQDSCSDDGTLDWLPHDGRVVAVIEKDQGMYDAINRGLRRARGELLAYLNCDEQYLPGALQKVSAFFERHPEVDVAFGDCVLVDAQGGYICDRKALTPQRLHTLVSDTLAFLTCATFFRRRVLDQHSLFFNTRFRIIGDAEWGWRLVENKIRTAVLREVTSAFTQTGENLCDSPKTASEREALVALAPWWARPLRPAIIAHFRLRRLLAGGYFLQPHEYAIFTLDSPSQRRRFLVDRPSFRWRNPERPGPSGR
jgi:glycosyltransferase involved in cell wall biosynthesis